MASSGPTRVTDDVGGSHPLDVDSPAFDPEAFVQYVIKEASLGQLMNQEAEIQRQIGRLDSDMQTLVYENYNKFIAATDTIKQMRVDFRAMEDQMDALATKMQDIKLFSSQISSTLHDRRSRVAELSSTHSLLQKLEFLLELPSTLKACLDDDSELATGVKNYLRTRKVLHQYEHMPSFKGIKEDCDAIILEVKDRLRSKLAICEPGSNELCECVELLLSLDEEAEEVCDLFLVSMAKAFELSMAEMIKQVKLASSTSSTSEMSLETCMDVLAFTDYGCNNYMSTLSLVMASFSNTFLSEDTKAKMEGKLAQSKLEKFVQQHMKQFVGVLRQRFEVEDNQLQLRVRALDRFHRRMQAAERLLESVDFSRMATELVVEVADLECKRALSKLNNDFDDQITKLRVDLLMKSNNTIMPDLVALNDRLLMSIEGGLKTILTELECFIEPDLTFASRSQFRIKFCRYSVREGLVVAFFGHMVEVAQVEEQTRSMTSPLLLLLSNFFNALRLSRAGNLLTLMEERFMIDDVRNLTQATQVEQALKSVSTLLLNEYVRTEGRLLSQMLRRSVETRDWCNALEPRAVRAVMRRVVEELGRNDALVGKLYEDDKRETRASDSSRRFRVVGQLEQSSVASNIEKLFNEKIEVFVDVQASKCSILTGITKMALKTLLECVRLKTLSPFAFQQVQVDCQFLQLFLWRFVDDENLVDFMLDEIIRSAAHRCPKPVPMEASVVNVICEKS